MKILKAVAFLTIMAICFSCSKEPTSPDISEESKPKGSISGILTDKNSRPIGGVIVSINADSAVPGVSALNGAFTVGRVSAGTYTLSFLHRDYESDQPVTATVTLGQDVIISDTIKLSYTYYILTGRITYNGSPVPGVGVTVAGTALSTLTDENGRYVIPRVEEALALKIICAKTGFGFNTLTGINGIRNDTTEVPDINLNKPGCKVTGVVRDSLGNPVSGAVVMAMGGGLTDTTDANGRYELTNFPSDNPDARIYILNYNGQTGGIMGVSAPDYTTLTGADIVLHAPASMNNGMALASGGIVASDTAQYLTLRVFPDADSATRIVNYQWYFGETVDGTPDTSTSTPWFTMRRTSFTARYSGITNGQYPLTVRAISAIGTYSTSVTIIVTVKTLTTADSSITHKGTLSVDTTWYPKNNPHIVEGTYNVNAKLTILPGVVVKFKTGASMRFGYYSGYAPALIAEGTQTDSIIFTSAESMPVPGSWSGIRFDDYTSDANTSLRYCAVRYAQNGISITSAQPSIVHCAITLSRGVAVLCNSGGFTKFDSNTISGNRSIPLQLPAAAVSSVLSTNKLYPNDTNAVRVGVGSSSQTIAATARWSAHGIPYQMMSNLSISNASGPVLTIAPGCTLLFASTYGITVGYINPGALVAHGTIDSPIVFSGLNATPGFWKGISFEQYNNGNISSLRHCIIEYSVHAIYMNYSQLSVTRSFLRHNSASAVYVSTNGGLKTFDSNTVINNRSYPINLHANAISQLGSCNIFSGNDSSKILVKSSSAAHYVSKSGLWRNFGIPYRFDADVRLEESEAPVITVAPGCTLLFALSKGIRVGYTEPGAFVAQGTPDSQIVFMGLSAIAGSWNGLTFEDDNNDNVSSLQHCVIKHAVNAVTLNAASGNIKNCNINKCSGTAITLSSSASFVSFDSNTITDNRSFPVNLHSDVVPKLGRANVLTGNDSNAIRLYGNSTSHYITASGRWLNFGIPYRLLSDLYIRDQSGPVITIAPGCTVEVVTGRGITVASNSIPGALIAEGTADSQIVFTGRVKSPGSWDGITFSDAAIDAQCRLAHCVVEYGGANSNGNIYVYNVNASISNCDIRNSSSWGIWISRAANTTTSGLTYSGNASGELYKQP